MQPSYMSIISTNYFIGFKDNSDSKTNRSKS